MEVGDRRADLDRPSPGAARADRDPAAGGSRGVALCHQVTTLDRAKLTERLGVVPPALLAAVESGLKAALDLE